VDWAKQGDVLLPASAGDPDHLRAWQPWVVEDHDGTLRMWYSPRPWGDDRLAYAIGSAVFPGPWPGSR